MFSAQVLCQEEWSAAKRAGDRVARGADGHVRELCRPAS